MVDQDTAVAVYDSVAVDETVGGTCPVVPARLAFPELWLRHVVSLPRQRALDGAEEGCVDVGIHEGSRERVI